MRGTASWLELFRLARLIERGISPDRVRTPETTYLAMARDRWYLFGGLALYLLTGLCAVLAGRAPLKWYLGWSVPSLLVSLALAVFGRFSTYNRLTQN